MAAAPRGRRSDWIRDLPPHCTRLCCGRAFPQNTGERLGFGITMILAMLANDITASEMMPVCNEKTFMDYLSHVCMLFGCLSLIETGIVMFIYHQQEDDWSGALRPINIVRLFRGVPCRDANKKR